MFRSMFTVGGFTLLSRLLGFVRDLMVTSYLGAGALGDVWTAAFRLPNLFRRIFGEGAFNAAFVPMYSRRLEEGGEQAASLFARRTISLMAVILLVLCVLSYIFMEPVIRLTNWGYANDERLEMAIPAARITIIYMIFVCLMAALSGILNSRRSFAAPAFAYVVLNIVFIAGLLIFVPKVGDPLKVLCWSVVVAGVLQLAVVVIACIRQGVSLRPRLPVIDDDMKKLGILMAPGLISAGIQQINLLVGQTVASIQSGGQVLIFIADRINQLPLGLIGMAAGVVLLPEITRNLRSGNLDQARSSMAKGMEISLFLCLPAMVAMLVIPGPMMYALFEGGKFSGKAALDSGEVLFAFALGTPAYVLARVLQPGYFAREDTKTPMRFTMISAGINIVLCWPLFHYMGVTGCALATSIAGWANTALLWVGLRKDNFAHTLPGFFKRLFGMFLAAMLMGVAIWFLTHAVGESWLLLEGRRITRMLALGVLVAIGVALYFFFILALRVFRLGDLKKVFRR